jgi:hypothetical protein
MVRMASQARLVLTGKMGPLAQSLREPAVQPSIAKMGQPRRCTTGWMAHQAELVHKDQKDLRDLRDRKGKRDPKGLRARYGMNQSWFWAIKWDKACQLERTL